MPGRSLARVEFYWTIVSRQDGEEYTVIKIADIKFNTGLEDSLFKME
ncbi:MAG: hypothetical protein JXB23_16685 [Candidatus Aminicenantes bacterium]|nr:hypothetical protein [Candidatus Aminicenantes bacterium]